MDNKQAAAVLLKAASAIPEFREIDVPMGDVGEACQRGADAIAMLAWLFESDRHVLLRGQWLVNDEGLSFYRYCEQQWKASRG